MDDLLKNAQNLGSQAVSSVGNLLSGAANAVESAFTPKPISPVPQAQTMPQAQPSGIQGLLSSLPQETMSAMNMVGQMFNQGEQGAQKTVGGLVNGAKQDIQSVQNFLSPQDNYRPDLSVRYNPQADKGDATPPLSPVEQYIKNNGFHFADNIKTGNPVTDWMAKTAAGVPQYIVNSPLLAAKAVGQGAQDISNGDILHPNVAASDIANLAMPVATIATLGGAPEAVGALNATEGFLPKVIQGLVGGAKIGAGFGALGAVGDNRNVTDPLQYVENIASGTVQGAGAGAFLGSTTGAISGLPDVFKKQTETAVAQQAAEDIQNGDNDLLNHEAIAPYKRALSIAGDQKTQGDLVNAISDIKTNGTIGDEDANNIINSVSQNLLPKGLTDRLNSIQLADTWEYLLARVNGRVPETVPSWMQPFDNAIFDISGKRALQAGKINFGAKIGGEEAPTTPDQGVSGTSLEAGDTPVEPSLKDQLQQPPLPPKMSSKAISEGLEAPHTGRDISVSPQAAKRFKSSGQEAIDFQKEMEAQAGKGPKTVDEILGGGKFAKNKNTITGEEGEQLGQLNPKNTNPLRPTKNKVDLSITGNTEKERVQSAIANSEYVRNSIITKGKDVVRSAQKLSPEDIKLAEQYQHGMSIEDMAKQSSNPTAMKTFLTKLSDYYDYRLAADRASGGSTQLRANYLPQSWDLSKPEDLSRFNQLAAQKGIKPWDGFRAQPRIFRTYAQGEALGFTRLRPNILEDLKADYQGASESISKQALKQGLLEAAPEHVATKGEGIDENGKPFINSNIKNMEGLSYTKPIDKLLQGFNTSKIAETAQDFRGKGFLQGAKDSGFGGTIGYLWDHATQPMKNFLLNLSFFHDLNVGVGNVGGKAFGQTVQGLLTLNPEEAGKGIKLGAEVGRATPALFSEKMVQAEDAKFQSKMVPGKNYSVFDAIQRSGSSLDRGMPSEGLSKINPLAATARSTFDRYLHVLKLHLGDSIFGDGKIDPTSPEGRAAGQELDKIMGELNDRTMNINPDTLKKASRFALAPQFTFSKFATLWDSATKGGPQGTIARQAVIGKSLLFGTISTLGTLLVTGKFPTLQRILLNYTFNPSIQTNITNPAGRKLSFDLPATYASELGRPGYETLTNPNHLAGIEQYGQARLNPLLAMGQQAATNQDFYGNPLLNPNSATPMSQQLLEGVVQNRLPIGGQQIANQLEGKQNTIQTVANLIGLRSHTSQDDPTVQYFNNLQQVRNGLKNSNEQAAFDTIHPTTTDQFGNKIPDAKVLDAQAKSVMYTKNQDLLDADMKLAKATQATGQPVDPVLLQPKAQAQAYYQWQSQDNAQKALQGETNPRFYALQRLQQPYYQQIQQEQQKQLQLKWSANPNQDLQQFMKNNPTVTGVQNGKVQIAQLPPDPIYNSSNQAVQMYGPVIAQLKSQGIVPQSYNLTPDQAIADYKYNNSLTAGSPAKDQFEANHPWVVEMKIPEASFESAYMQYQYATRPQGQSDSDFVKSQLANYPGANIKGIQDGKVVPAYNPLGSPMYTMLTPHQRATALLYTAYGSDKMSGEKSALLAQSPWLPNYWNANTSYYAQPDQVASQKQQQTQITPGLATQFMYGGSGAYPSTSQTAGLRRSLRREFTYENKGMSAKVSSMLGRAENPIASKKPKMSTMFGHVTRPIGNRKTISTMPKHGKSYETHSVASLMGSSSRPKFHKLPLPTRGKAKNIFI